MVVYSSPRDSAWGEGEEEEWEYGLEARIEGGEGTGPKKTVMGSMNEGVDKARHPSPRGREKKGRGARGMEAS